MVILVDQVLSAYAYDVSKELSIFIGLDYNQLYSDGSFGSLCFRKWCLEIFPGWNWKRRGIWSYLIIVAFFRELVRFWKTYWIFKSSQMSFMQWDMKITVDVLSPMALITVGILIWIQRARNRKLIEKN